ncbi:Myosin-binding protein 7 isoform C, partial [Glycine soja]
SNGGSWRPPVVVGGGEEGVDSTYLTMYTKSGDWQKAVVLSFTVANKNDALCKFTILTDTSRVVLLKQIVSSSSHSAALRDFHDCPIHFRKGLVIDSIIKV